MLLKWEATFLLTTCKLNVLLNRLTACINLRGKSLHLLLDRCWLRLVVGSLLLRNLTYLALHHLSLLLTIWSFYLPTIQLIEPASVSRLVRLQTDVCGNNLAYLNAELLNLIRTVNLDNGS